MKRSFEEAMSAPQIPQNSHDETATAATNLGDERKPYEAPKLVKKRAIAQATLQTPVQGPSATMLTVMG